MKIFLNEGNQIHNFKSSSGTSTDFLTNYGSGSTSQKVTVPTVPVLVPQHWQYLLSVPIGLSSCIPEEWVFPQSRAVSPVCPNWVPAVAYLKSGYFHKAGQYLQPAPLGSLMLPT